MKYISQKLLWLKKIKSTQSTQHKSSNRRIINTLQESLSIPWNTGGAIPGGENFSSWAFWTTYTNLASCFRSNSTVGKEKVFLNPLRIPHWV